MFIFNVYLLCKTNMEIFSYCHLENRSAFNWPIKQTCLALSKKKKKKKPERKGDHSGYQKTWDFPVMKKQFFLLRGCPHLLLDISAVSAVPYLCWSCLLQWKAHLKSAGFISLVPAHVNLLPSTCAKSSKILGLLHYKKKSVRIWKPRFVSEGVLCADFPLWGLYKSH